MGVIAEAILQTGIEQCPQFADPGLSFRRLQLLLYQEARRAGRRVTDEGVSMLKKPEPS